MKRATDYQNSSMLDHLCDALLSKLAQRAEGQLTFNQGVVGSNPTRLTTKLGD